MRSVLVCVILSKTKDLVFSANYEVEILRLRLRMTIAKQSKEKLSEGFINGLEHTRIMQII